MEDPQPEPGVYAGKSYGSWLRDLPMRAAGEGERSEGCHRQRDPLN